MKLIKMTDYVLEQWELAGTKELQKYYNIAKYAYFLKQPLELWMFVPVDENGDVLENLESSITAPDLDEWKKFKQAKERCLFEGFETNAINYHISRARAVDYLANFGTIELTKTAIKNLGL